MAAEKRRQRSATREKYHAAPWSCREAHPVQFRDVSENGCYVKGLFPGTCGPGVVPQLPRKCYLVAAAVLGATKPSLTNNRPPGLREALTFPVFRSWW